MDNMADQNYLDELLYTPQETTFGLPAQIIAKNLPAVVNPYGSTGSNLAAVVGGGLLAGLLQYGAKREAEAANRELAPRLLDVMAATSQEQLAQKLAQPGYERLAGLGSRLSLAMAENQRKQAIEEAKQKAEVDRQQKLKLYESTLMNNPEVQQALRTQKGIEFAFREPKQAELTPEQKPLPAGIGEKIALKTDAVTAARALIEKIKVIPAYKLKGAQVTGISAITGDTGIMQEIEQFATNYRASKFGMSLTGNEKNSFDIATGNKIAATKEDILAAYKYLAKTALNEAEVITKTVTRPASETLKNIQELQQPSETQQPIFATDEEKRQRIEQIKQMLGKK